MPIAPGLPPARHAKLQLNAIAYFFEALRRRCWLLPCYQRWCFRRSSIQRTSTDRLCAPRTPAEGVVYMEWGVESVSKLQAKPHGWPAARYHDIVGECRMPIESLLGRPGFDMTL